MCDPTEGQDRRVHLRQYLFSHVNAKHIKPAFVTKHTTKSVNWRTPGLLDLGYDAGGTSCSGHHVGE